MIWIAKEIREEHRAVISWLNAHTTSEYAFFGIEVSAVRIADSPIAPVFTVVEKPNSWVRSIQQHSRASSQEIGERNQAFWDAAIISYPDLQGIGVRGFKHSNRWLEIPGSSLILSLALTSNGVGWFIRGPHGTNDEETAQLLGEHFNTLSGQLECLQGKPFLSRWFDFDWKQSGAQQTLLSWLVEEKNKVMKAFKDLNINC